MPRARTFELHDYVHSVGFEVPGIDRDYANALHVGYGFHEYWPMGMLGHIAYVTGDDLRGLGIWSDSHAEEQFFNEVVLESLTKSIKDLGAPESESGSSSFGFTRRSIERLIVSSDCFAFTDIGADADGSAIHALGTDPVATVAQSSDSNTRTNPDELPDGLLLLLVERSGGEAIETRLWATKAAAFADNEAAELYRVHRISFSAGLLRRAIGSA